MVLCSRVDVAPRIGCDAADGEELSRETAAAADSAHLRQRVALQHDDFLVVAVGDEDVPLLRVARQRDVPHRTGRRHDEVRQRRGAAYRHAFRVLHHDPFFHELPVLLEHLDAIAGPIADVDHAVFREFDARDVAELPRRRR